ncbi:MAG TPA: DUF6491 family protein [Rhizomicrobium sp.]|nr:DUF6491 family protein [Rhizomicrobium sp.]
MRRLLGAALAAATLLAGAPAFATDAPCVRQDDIRNWNALDDKNIVLESYHHQKVLLKLIGTCSGFKFSEALQIRARGESGLSCVQAGDSVVTRTGIGGRCAIVSVTAYTGDMKAHHDAGDSHGTSGHNSY